FTFERFEVDNEQSAPHNSQQLRRSNCFLIVSPLFLLCRIRRDRKVRAIFFACATQSLQNS
ncbi:MAG: hypothetical protein ACN6N0_10160, partial [Microvirgula sp.]